MGNEPQRRFGNSGSKNKLPKKNIRKEKSNNSKIYYYNLNCAFISLTTKLNVCQNRTPALIFILTTIVQNMSQPKEKMK